MASISCIFDVWVQPPPGLEVVEDCNEAPRSKVSLSARPGVSLNL